MVLILSIHISKFLWISGLVLSGWSLVASPISTRVPSEVSSGSSSKVSSVVSSTVSLFLEAVSADMTRFPAMETFIVILIFL